MREASWARELECCFSQAGAQSGLHQSCRHSLQEAITLACSTTGGLLDDLLGRGQCLELLTTARGFSLEIRCLGHAVVVKFGKCLDILRETLGSHVKITFSSGLLLIRLRLALLGLVHLFVCKLDLISERLLQHLKVLDVCSLRCPCGIKLRLRFLQQIIHGVDDTSALVLIRSWVWSTIGLIIAG